MPQDYDHSGCDGHVVVQPRTWNEAIDIEQLCRDPQANGHGLADWSRARSDSAAVDDDPAAKEAQREERRRVIRCNREWRAARTVRRQHLREVLQRRSAPKASLALITTLAAEGAHNDAPSVLAELLGVETADGAWRPQRDLLTAWLGETPADPRRTLAPVAMFVAHVEQQDLHDNRWRSPAQGGRAEAYLDWLLEHTGY